jgi:hydroxypyruvate isomerase
MITDFTLAAFAEMIFTELPIIERVRHIDDLGFQVEIWDWTKHTDHARHRPGQWRPANQADRGDHW